MSQKVKTPFPKYCVTILILLLIIVANHTQAQDSSSSKIALPKVGASSILGSLNDLSIEAMVQSPSADTTDLQIICLFEYTEGDIFNSPPALPAAANGIVHVDNQLHGLITDLRKSGKFAGHRLETLLIIPPTGTIVAKKLLLIGLGDRNKFTPDLMVDIGRTGMREALRLGVTNYAHASDLKDGGIDSPTGLVASNVVKGAIDAYETQRYLESKQASNKSSLSKIILLTGQPFYDVSGKAIKQFIESYSSSL